MAPKKSGAAPTRVSSRQAANEADQAKTAKPTANTKAKVTKPAAKGKATTANKAAATKTAKAAAAKTAKAAKDVKPAAKGRGKPKAAATTTATATKTKAAATKAAKAKQPTTTAKAAPKKKTGQAAKNEEPAAIEEKPVASRKRKAVDEPDAAPAPAKKAKVIKKGPVINSAPTERLSVYVCGAGENGELGLGTLKKHTNVKRPRLHPYLSPATVGVVQIAAGGMHNIALTHDNKILTWGVSDKGALGRDTQWEGGLKDMDAAEDSEDDENDPDAESGLNPREAVPGAIPSDAFPADTVFTQVAAGDSCSFALTDDGQVWGWGHFRDSQGAFRFSEDVEIQREPVLISGLKKITSVVCGANHALALDANGAVFAWGAGDQFQLGRRVVERTKVQGLIPREFGLPKKAVKYISAGDYHSFAIDNKDRVWAWGMNSTGEAGIAENVLAAHEADEGGAFVPKPEIIKSLAGKKLTCIQGGAKHSIAVTDTGDCLTWGRIDSKGTGIEPSDLREEDIIRNPRTNKPLALINPTKVPGIDGKVAYATASSDHSIAITDDGRAYSWGFSVAYQTGQGTDEDIDVPTLIDNTATRGKKLNFATAGSQFSVLTSVDEEAPKTNGV